MKENTWQILKSALLLALVAIIGSGFLVLVYTFTAERIAAQERRVVLEQLGQVLAPEHYDNALHDDRFSVVDEAWFRHDEPVLFYRARRDNEDVAAIVNLVAPDGYNGDIRLLVGIFLDGSVSGVRVIEHRETPGLGDPIELARSPWVLDFDGRSLGNPSRKGWAVRSDGGEFDQFTGATITPRAVVEAVQRALEYFQANQAAIFATPQVPVE